MPSYHYLGLRCLAGRSLRYVPEWHGEWIALLGWQAAALNCASRDAWVGCPPNLQFQRLHRIANSLLLPLGFPSPCAPRVRLRRRRGKGLRRL